MVNYSQHQINTMSTDLHMFGHYSINMNSKRMHMKFLKLILGVERNYPFLKLILRVERNCPTLCVLGETGE